MLTAKCNGYGSTRILFIPGDPDLGSKISHIHIKIQHFNNIIILKKEITFLFNTFEYYKRPYSRGPAIVPSLAKALTNLFISIPSNNPQVPTQQKWHELQFFKIYPIFLSLWHDIDAPKILCFFCINNLYCKVTVLALHPPLKLGFPQFVWYLLLYSFEGGRGGEYDCFKKIPRLMYCTVLLGDEEAGAWGVGPGVPLRLLRQQQARQGTEFISNQGNNKKIFY